MRLVDFLLTGLAATAALAAPHLATRQHQLGQPFGPLIYSPPNLTSVTPGATVNFAYLAQYNTTVAVQVALIQIIPVGESFARKA